MAEQAAALPDSVLSIGEQLQGGNGVMPAAELFQDRGVFAAEYARIFLRPWTAVEHASRLDADGRYFRFETATRSVVVVRDTEGQVHALRNACLHAGYRVCEAEDGVVDHLHCVYHDWEYALDGELTVPALTRRHDNSRYRLARYPLRISNGLILVDLSTENADSATAEPTLPDWLADAKVTGRARYSAALNWKYLRAWLLSAPELFLDGPPDAVLEFGALGFLASRAGQAALVRIAPKFPEQTEFQVIRLALPEAGPVVGNGIEEALCRTGEAIAAAPLAWLDRDFFAWYWSMMDQR